VTFAPASVDSLRFNGPSHAGSLGVGVYFAFWPTTRLKAIRLRKLANPDLAICHVACCGVPCATLSVFVKVIASVNAYEYRR
jgi:hypothetical protein